MTTCPSCHGDLGGPASTDGNAGHAPECEAQLANRRDHGLGRAQDRGAMTRPLTAAAIRQIIREELAVRRAD